MERNKNLIAISGKIGSGKSTVGKIIQYLISNEKRLQADKISYKKFLINYNVIDYSTNNYQTKMFADKLKDIVCLLIDCTKKNLENQEFKEKELGEEWWVWLQTSSYGGEDKLYSYLQYPTAPSFPHCSLIKLTPRMLLQEIGTQLFRQQLHPQIWVNSLFSNYKPFIKNYPNLIKSNGKDLIAGDNYSMGKAIYPSWIITDCRFKNELEAVKQRGGITIRVERDNWKPEAGEIIEIKVFSHWTPITYTHSKENLHYGVGTDGFKYESSLIRKYNQHPSETDLDNQKFDYLINNDGSISDLIDKVREILLKEGII